ncbi:helix-turn-helix domain-containing protein [Geminicoccus sp.]|uniref:helix-turn-helix domain-containing protein n=1 Tax=Geminicoccus sp. TaxID=2024832 RepID=UPI0039C87904
MLSATKRELGHLSGMDVGERIRLARTRQKLSQRDVAKRLGVSPSAVAQWESGNTKPSHDNLTKMAMIFDLDYERLISNIPGSNRITAQNLEEEALLLLWRHLTPAARSVLIGLIGAGAAEGISVDPEAKGGILGWLRTQFPEEGNGNAKQG